MNLEKRSLPAAVFAAALTLAIQSAGMPLSAQTFSINQGIYFFPIITTDLELGRIDTLTESPYQGLSLSPIDPNRKVQAVFTGVTTAGQNVSLIMLYQGNIITPSRVNQTGYDTMIPLIRAFFNDRNASPRVYSKLTLTTVKRQFGSSWSVGSESTVKLAVSNPVRGNSTGTGPNGGVESITVCGSGDFFAEATILRMENCSVNAQSARKTKFYVLRNPRTLSVKMNNVPAPVNFLPASAGMAIQFATVAVDGVPYLDISGATKLFTPSSELPQADGCIDSIYLLDSFPLILING